MEDNFKRTRLRKAKVWVGAGLALVVGIVGTVQLLDDDSALLTQVLGATAKKPDETPPSVSIAFPVANRFYGAGSWLTVRGTASDATGVQSVAVSIGATQYPVNGTTSWTSTIPLPSPDGTYTISVTARDSATPSSNTSNPVTVTFRVDTQAPGKPVITSGPENPTFDTGPQFRFTGESGATFECQLDGNAQSCSSPVSYKKLSVGDHTFQVVATDPAGNRSTASDPYQWTILENKAFGITGDLAQPLYPGGTQRLDLRLSNPYNFPIQVTGISVSATSATTGGQPNSACINELQITGLSGGPSVVLPGDGTSLLSSFLTASQSWPTGWPTVTFKNDPVRNQDACKNTVFEFSYTGTAIKR